MDRDIHVNWRGRSILLPREGFKKSEGSHLSDQQKETALKGGVPRLKKSKISVRFYAANTQNGLESITMGVERLDELAGLT
jgi:hypothetical protein